MDVEPKQMYETNSMVEEFMLLANVSVAQFIYDKFPKHALLRHHPAPPLSNFEPLVQAAKGAGFFLDTSSSLRLAQTLEQAHSDKLPYANTLLRILVKISSKQEKKRRRKEEEEEEEEEEKKKRRKKRALLLNFVACRPRAACCRRRTFARAPRPRSAFGTTAWRRPSTRTLHRPSDGS